MTISIQMRNLIDHGRKKNDSNLNLGDEFYGGEEVLVQFVCGSRNYIHKTPDINYEFKRRKKRRTETNAVLVLFSCIDVTYKLKERGRKKKKKKKKPPSNEDIIITCPKQRYMTYYLA